METEILVRNQQQQPVDEIRLIKTSRRSLQFEGFDRPSELSILLVDDKEMRRLNLEYRRLDKPTDVLSFSQLEGVTPLAADAPVPLGDVVISVDTAMRQAAEHAHSVGDEMDLLIVHGILHLLGYDDETDEGAEEMKRRELLILAAP